VTIHVHNQSEPISDGNLATLFESFSHEDKALKKSWGLGLTLIKTVAKCHGGDVIVTSNIEDDTTFTIKLCKHYRKHGEEEVKRI